MKAAIVEHLNITVEKPVELAQALCELLGWKVRWQGDSKDNGYTVHVGSEHSYLALYTPPKLTGEPVEPYLSDRAMNHIGVVVDDLDEIKQMVLNSNIAIHNENDTAPGRRFYFHLHGIEFEAVEY